MTYLPVEGDLMCCMPLQDFFLVLMSFTFSSLYCIAGIRQLQLMLLKMALLLGIEIHVNVEFKALIEPPEDQETESK